MNRNANAAVAATIQTEGRSFRTSGVTASTSTKGLTILVRHRPVQQLRAFHGTLQEKRDLSLHSPPPPPQQQKDDTQFLALVQASQSICDRLENNNNNSTAIGHSTTTIHNDKSPTVTASEWQDLLQQWKRLLSTSDSSQRPQDDALSILDQLYEAWCRQYAFPPTLSSSPSSAATLSTSSAGGPSSTTTSSSLLLSEREAPLLPLWLELYTQRRPHGPRALEILQGWTVCFGAHLEWQPQRRHYDWVLQAYANSGGGRNDHATTTTRPQNPYEASQVAMEILQLLDDFSFTMKPAVTTYLWALQCVAQCASDHHNNNNNNYDENESDNNNIKSQSAALQDLLTRAESKVLLPSLPSLDDLSTHELFLLKMETLCTIICATERVPEEAIDGPTWTPWLQAWVEGLSSQNNNNNSSSSHGNNKNHWIRYWKDNPRDILDLLGQTIPIALNLYKRKANSSSSSRHDDRQTWAMEALQILHACEDMETKLSVSLLRPADYVTVMEIWKTQAVSPDVTVIMEEILQRLKEQHERRRRDEQMTALQAKESYECLMRAFVLVGGYREVLKVHRLMIAERIPWDDGVFDIILKAALESQNRHVTEYALKLLKRTVQTKKRYVTLQSWHFEIMLQSLLECNHKQGPDLARDIFRLLEEVARERNSQVRLDANLYAKYAQVLSRSNTPGTAQEIMNLMEALREKYKKTNLEPNDDMFAALVAALGRSSSVSAARQAQELWQDLVHRGKADVRAYVAVMYAWMNSGRRDAIDRVEEIFARLQADAAVGRVQPSKVAYRALLEAWAKSGKAEASTRAIEIVDDFETKVSNGSMTDEKADVKLYTAAMRAVWKSNVHGAAPIVEKLYDRLVQSAKYRSDDLEIQPDTAALTVVLQTWANSIDPDKARHVYEKWQEMLSQYEEGNLRMKPTVVAASAVLHACAYTTATKGSSVRMQAVDNALEVWQDIQDHSLINDVLVVKLLSVFGRHVDDYEERARLATVAFQQACVAGCVSTKVIDALHLYVPTLFKQLPTNEEQKISVPPHWTRALREQQYNGK